MGYLVDPTDGDPLGDVTEALRSRVTRGIAEKSLRDFAQQAWHVCEPSTPLIWNWHLDAICDHLQALSQRQIRNLIINVPPGHMKSLLVCVFWPAWWWLTAPFERWLFSSYAEVLSVRDSVRCRRLIESPWYQAGWKDRYQLTEDQNQKTRFENTATGYRIATSVGGVATGERGNFVAVDDPHNVKERESDVKREGALVWWDEVMSTRLNDPRRDCKLIIQQRVHEKDVSGHVLAQGGYEHLVLPTEYDPARRCVTSLGWSDPRKRHGELLFPKRFGTVEIAEAKLRLGPYGYAGQHQQAPAPAGGGRFKAAWFRSYRAEGNSYALLNADGTVRKIVPVADCDRFACCDPAGTEKELDNKPCYTVIGVWDITPDGEMVKVDHAREMMETPDAVDRAVNLVRKYNCDWLAVEKNGLGLGVVQTIRRRGVAVRAVLARSNKLARSETAEIRMAAGTIYFPENAPWVQELHRELLLFPNGEYADQVDELSWAALMVQRARGALMLPEDWKAAGMEPPRPGVAEHAAMVRPEDSKPKSLVEALQRSPAKSEQIAGEGEESAVPLIRPNSPDDDDRPLLTLGEAAEIPTNQPAVLFAAFNEQD